MLVSSRFSPYSTTLSPAFQNRSLNTNAFMNTNTTGSIRFGSSTPKKLLLALSPLLITLFGLEMGQLSKTINTESNKPDKSKQELTLNWSDFGSPLLGLPAIPDIKSGADDLSSERIDKNRENIKKLKVFSFFTKIFNSEKLQITKLSREEYNTMNKALSFFTKILNSEKLQIIKISKEEYNTMNKFTYHLDINGKTCYFIQYFSQQADILHQNLLSIEDKILILDFNNFMENDNFMGIKDISSPFLQFSYKQNSGEIPSTEKRLLITEKEDKKLIETFYTLFQNLKERLNHQQA